MSFIKKWIGPFRTNLTSKRKCDSPITVDAESTFGWVVVLAERIEKVRSDLKQMTHEKLSEELDWKLHVMRGVADRTTDDRRDAIELFLSEQLTAAKLRTKL